MRTGKLRRWVLRGALLSAAVIAPLLTAGPAQADFTWQEFPPSGGGSSVTADSVADGDQASQLTEDFTWQ